jgi:hypothetical protein
MTLPQRSLAVVGANFPNPGKQVNRRFEISMCSPAELLDLVPEPKNPADEHAIAVYSARNIQIGYLRSVDAVFISSLLRRGETVRAVFQEAATWGALARVSFDGEVPVIPVKRQGERQDPDDVIDEDPGFYPDEEWGE